MCYFIDWFLAVGDGSRKMVVMPTKLVEWRAQMKAAVATLLDPWAQFYAAADEGGEVSSASATEGMAATLTRQLHYVTLQLSQWRLFVF